MILALIDMIPQGLFLAVLGIFAGLWGISLILTFILSHFPFTPLALPPGFMIGWLSNVLPLNKVIASPINQPMQFTKTFDFSSPVKYLESAGSNVLRIQPSLFAADMRCAVAMEKANVVSSSK